MKQTAVEWLIEEFYQQIEMSAKNMLGTNRGTDYRIGLAKAIEFCQQAKEIEKEQAKNYAEFAIRCDRKKLPILEFNGFVKL